MQPAPGRKDPDMTPVSHVPADLASGLVTLTGCAARYGNVQQRPDQRDRRQ